MQATKKLPNNIAAWHPLWLRELRLMLLIAHPKAMLLNPQELPAAAKARRNIIAE
jgi:hypothetical protein